MSAHALRDGVTLRRLARNTSKLLLRDAPVVDSSVTATRVAPPRRIPFAFAQAGKFISRRTPRR